MVATKFLVMETLFCGKKNIACGESSNLSIHFYLTRTMFNLNRPAQNLLF